MGSSRSEQKRSYKKADAQKFVESHKRSFEPTHFKMPEGVEKYKLEGGKDGIAQFDPLPYITGFGNREADEGFMYFCLPYSVHKIPTPNGKFENERFLCLKETFDKPCPVCKKRFDRGTSEEQKDALRGQRRMAMYVNPEPGSTSNIKVKLFDSAYYNRKLGFGEKLTSAINMADDHDAATKFYWPDEGFTLKVEVADEKYGSVSQINFRKRGYKYPEDAWIDLPSLEDCLVVPMPKELKAEGKALSELDDDDWRLIYKELERIMLEGMGEDVGGPEDAAPARTPPPDDDEEEEEEEPRKASDVFKVGLTVQHEGKRKKIKKINPDSSLDLSDEDGLVDKHVDPDEVGLFMGASEEDEGEDEEEEAPRRVSRR